MTEELISVIVPLYNTKAYLERCLKSICNQTYKNLEIIVVDDGSTDGSEHISDEYAEKDSRIVVVHQENGGLPAARRTGLKTSTADYISFVDSDDWIEPDMIECLWKALVDNDAEISVGRQFLDKGETSHIEAARSYVKGLLTKSEIPHHVIYSDDFKTRGVSPNFCDKLYKKDIIANRQYKLDLNTKYAEDDICVYGALLDADRVAFVDKPLYHYCRRDDSMTSAADNRYFERVTLFYLQMKQVFEEHSESELLIKKLNRYMIEFILRGVNKSFGFCFGNVIPFYLPPYKTLQERGARDIVLYGAGDVGKDYYNSLKQSGYNIVAWADKRGEYLATQGYDTIVPEKLKGLKYDALVIASDSEDLMKQMKATLVEKVGVDSDKIIAEYPVKFIEKLMEQ
ncbi:glycosyltransferase family 2 protein [Butyrivibrio fibrisolvens]|uniref:glycosyltransferase family 2 protein n=1 Tax=Butyrivibrio fibrisolvens TaxID=831 RepID=UPI0004192DD7|nr:glycosyltransferase family 2 protein [Butyrivibrio fibrisolvens]